MFNGAFNILPTFLILEVNEKNLVWIYIFFSVSVQLLLSVPNSTPSSFILRFHAKSSPKLQAEGENVIVHSWKVIWTFSVELHIQISKSS